VERIAGLSPIVGGMIRVVHAAAIKFKVGEKSAWSKLMTSDACSLVKSRKSFEGFPGENGEASSGETA